MRKLGRRLFMRIGLAGFVAFVTIQWDKIVSYKIESSKNKITEIPFNKNKTVDFADDYIIINKDGNTKVLSAFCTHLGCKISETVNGKLVCPCHGSEYDLEGHVLKGPAYKSLEIIQASISEDGTQLTING